LHVKPVAASVAKNLGRDPHAGVERRFVVGNPPTEGAEERGAIERVSTGWAMLLFITSLDTLIMPSAYLD